MIINKLLKSIFFLFLFLFFFIVRSSVYGQAAPNTINPFSITPSSGTAVTTFTATGKINLPAGQQVRGTTVSLFSGSSGIANTIVTPDTSGNFTITFSISQEGNYDIYAKTVGPFPIQDSQTVRITITRTAPPPSGVCSLSIENLRDENRLKFTASFLDQTKEYVLKNSLDDTEIPFPTPDSSGVSRLEIATPDLPTITLVQFYVYERFATTPFCQQSWHVGGTVNEDILYQPEPCGYSNVGVPGGGGQQVTKIMTAIGCIPVEPAEFIKVFLNWAIALAGGIAFIFMLFAAFQILTSRGNPEALKAGQEQLTAAAIGLLFIIFSVFLLRIVGVPIMNLGA